MVWLGSQEGTAPNGPPVKDAASSTVPNVVQRADATSGTYRPALDGLRAVAVLAVLYSHFWELGTPLGHLGVRLFFVLSGFLITGILLGARERASTEGFGSVYWIFMARRVLRLFPAYYLLVLVLLLANVQDIRAVATWHLAHASNILFSIRNDHVPWVTAHHWSLSVEEQFYLLWPLVVLTVRDRWLWPTVLATAAAGIAFRCVALMVSDPQLAHYYLPFASLDALGGGALLALHVRSGGTTRSLKALGAACGAVVTLVLAVPLFSDAAGTAGHYIVVEALAVPAMAALVAGCAGTHVNLLIRVLSITPVVALGRISYGIYLYHVAVFAALLKAAPILGLGPVDRGPATFFVGTLMTIAIASLSWRLMERPLLMLKSRIPY